MCLLSSKLLKSTKNGEGYHVYILGKKEKNRSMLFISTTKFLTYGTPAKRDFTWGLLWLHTPTGYILKLYLCLWLKSQRVLVNPMRLFYIISHKEKKKLLWIWGFWFKGNDIIEIVIQSVEKVNWLCATWTRLNCQCTWQEAKFIIFNIVIIQQNVTLPVELLLLSSVPMTKVDNVD